MAVTWRFDGDDRLCGVDGQWDEFALANDGNACIPAPFGESLGDFVNCADLCVLWGAIFRLARREPDRPVTLTYRCDAPHERRIMRATVVSNARSEIDIVSPVEHCQPRPAVPLLDASAGVRSTDMIRMCAWCARVHVDGWVDVDEGCRRLGLLEVDTGPLPTITHGMCEECMDGVTAGLDLSPGLLPGNRRHLSTLRLGEISKA